MDHDEQSRLAEVGRLGRFAIDINGDVDQYAIDTGLAGFDLPDPIAMAVALDDSIIVESTDEWLVVGLDGPTAWVHDPGPPPRSSGPNIRVLWSVDEAAFKQRLFTACAD